MPGDGVETFGQGLTCRRIDKADLPSLVSLDRDVMSACGMDRPVDHPRRADLRDAAQVYAPPGGTMLVVLHGRRLVAMGGFLAESDADSTARLKRLRVVSDWRRRGIAKRLVARLERLAADSGYRVMCLHVTARQPAALSLYRAKGYRAIDRLDGDFGPEYRLQKSLDA